MIQNYGEGGLDVMRKDMTGKEGREIGGSNAVEGFEGQDKQFVLNTGVHWEPVEKCKD